MKIIFLCYKYSIQYQMNIKIATKFHKTEQKNTYQEKII